MSRLLLTVPSYILQGDDDTTVDIRMSHKLVNLMKTQMPVTNVKFEIAHGQDHGFDLDVSIWEKLYAKAGLDFITKAWLK